MMMILRYLRGVLCTAVTVTVLLLAQLEPKLKSCSCYRSCICKPIIVITYIDNTASTINRSNLEEDPLNVIYIKTKIIQDCASHAHECKKVFIKLCLIVWGEAEGK